MGWVELNSEAVTKRQLNPEHRSKTRETRGAGCAIYGIGMVPVRITSGGNAKRWGLDTAQRGA
jgi:hypothetical protein